jgi:metal-responsive CopG/Arc/MetJ family transcriptional regulator
MTQKREHERFSVSIPSDVNGEFEDLRSKLNISRSDAIKKAMQLFINRESDQLKEPDMISVLGTITYLEKAHVHGHPQYENEEIRFALDSIKQEEGASEKVLQDPEIESKSGSHHHGDFVHTHESTDGYYTPIEKLESVQITELEHTYLDVIISTTHIHAGPEKCMLNLAVRGNLKKIKELVKKLSQFKIVENIQFVIVERY